MAYVSTYLNFVRDTEAAFNFYKSVFGALIHFLSHLQIRHITCFKICRRNMFDNFLKILLTEALQAVVQKTRVMAMELHLKE